MVPPSCTSISPPIKWGRAAGIDSSAAFFWKCSRFFPVALSEWWSSPRLSSRFLPKLGSHNAYVRGGNQWISFYIILLQNTHILLGKIWNTPLDPSVLLLPDCLQCETSSGFQINLWSSLNLRLVCFFRIQSWLSSGFLKYASNYCYAWEAGELPVWMARLSHAVAGMGVLSEPCVDYREIVKIIWKKKSKVPYFREIWPYGFDWSIISSFKSSDQIIELINDFPWFYMCWHELSLSAAY